MSLSPIQNLNAPWQNFNLKDIWTGPSGVGQRVPNAGDMVTKIEGNVITQYQVVSVDPTTLVSTLTELSPPSGQGTLNAYDALVSSNGNRVDAFRLYVNKKVTPHAAAVDHEFAIWVNNAAYARVFVGTDLTNSGNIVSARYDNSGNYVSDTITLSLSANDRWQNNVGVKVLDDFFTSAELVDGQIVTLVVYNSSNSVIYKQQLIVENTGFVKGLETNTKYVVGVGLKSPFLSINNSFRINYPVNLPLTTDNLIGVVYYSDGTTKECVVDGTTFSVLGLESYVSGLVGATYDVLAKYVLQAGESGYGVNTTGSPHVSQAYKLITVSANMAYQVRLFPYPVWNGNTNQYSLKWLMLAMDRTTAYDVTSYVTLVNGTAFNPTQLGVKQTIRGSLNLKFVNPVYQSFIYTQDCDVILESLGTYRQTGGTPPNWHVSAVSGRTPMYGDGIWATFYNNGTSNAVTVSGSYTTLDTWLAATLYKSQPLINTPSETVVPVPTHFAVKANGVRSVYAISNWNQSLTLTQSLTNSDTITLEFITRTNGGDLITGVIGMPMYQVSISGVNM